MAQRVTYAIGDIHGRFDLLEAALSQIERHSAGLRRRIVFLGDYVDRGPESRSVVERLIPLNRAGEIICLKGNHEALMVDALNATKPGAFARWGANGGHETLASYGARDHPDPACVIPHDHVRWMTTLPLTSADPHRIYVHAGFSPRKPLEDQSEETCLWIREKFLRAPGRDLPGHVVHGHTPYWEGKPDPEAPELLDHRTNLDTAAFATGILTIGVFDTYAEGGPIEVLTARGPPREALFTPVDQEDVAASPPSLLRRLWPRKGWSGS
jgi:serine/threonine protein phosphatase 1